MAERVNILSNSDYSANNPYTEPTRDNYQRYPYDYYSGTDCKIFFGDIWVDDIVTIQYSINQTKTPIYGYASQNYDAVCKGQVLVQGTLSIAFKEVGYLNTIQYVMDGQKERVHTALADKIVEYSDGAKKGTVKYIPQLDGLTGVTISANGTPQIIRQEQTIEQILSARNGNNTASGLWKDLYGGNTTNRDFEDFAEALEDTIWGDANGKPYELKKYLRRVDEFDYNRIGGITVGSDNDYSECLNILLAFGDINDYRAEHTLVSLNDVHFTSSSMVVSPDGNPIAEVYQFFARDINRSIQQSSSTFKINPIKLNMGIDASVSKLSDIAEIEKELNQSSQKVIITTLSRLTSNGWSPVSMIIGEGTLNINKSEPYVDQLIRVVSSIFNETITTTDASQYLISANVGDGNNINMILEQTFPNTRSYKVISPTRDNYLASNILSRDDLWKNTKVITNEDIRENNSNPKNDFENTKELGDILANVGKLNKVEDKIPTTAQIVDSSNPVEEQQNKPNPIKSNAIYTQKAQDFINQYTDSFVKTGLEYGIEPGVLVANMAMESGFNTSAISSTGAVGLSQFTAEGIKAINNRYPSYIKDTFGITKNPKDLTSSDYEYIKKQIASDPDTSIDAMGRLLSINKTDYVKKNNVNPTAAEQRAMYVGGLNYNKSNNSAEANNELNRFNQQYSNIGQISNISIKNEEKEKEIYINGVKITIKK